MLTIHCLSVLSTLHHFHMGWVCPARSDCVPSPVVIMPVLAGLCQAGFYVRYVRWIPDIPNIETIPVIGRAMLVSS